MLLLQDITRRFPVLLDVGSGFGYVAKHVDKHTSDLIVQVEMAGASRLCAANQPALIGFVCVHTEEMIKRDRHEPREVPTLQVVADEERLPIAENSVDGAVSSLSLHWVNDLVGALSQISRALKPDAPFIGAMLGGDTLFELRSSLQVAQQEREGGFSPHVSPFVGAVLRSRARHCR